MPHLIITRGVGESVVITVPPSNEEQKVHVEVLEREGGKIRLGIAANREVLILRGELVDRPRNP